MSNGIASRSAHFDTITSGQQKSSSEGYIAICVSFIAGSIWYLLDALNLYRGAWIAVPIGAAIALAVRSVGNRSRSYRSVLSLGCYLLTVLGVVVLLASRELAGVYDGIAPLETYEESIVRTRFQNPFDLLAYAIGGLVAAQLAYLRTATSRA